MFGKFNIMNMSDRDMILLGKPWLTAMNPDIDWAKDTLQLPSTPRSLRLKKAFEKLWRENSAPNPTPPLKPKKKVSIKEEEDLEQFAPLHSPLPKDGKRTLERWKEKKKKGEPVPALIPDPDDESLQYNTMEDVWDDSSMFTRKVEDPITYPINDDEVLIEYAQDGSSVTLHENLSFNSPLTWDGTSASEIQQTAALRPLRNSWIYAWKTEEDEYLKTSNKAQEFALKDAQEKKKKTFEELVPDYLHDFTDVFAKDGLNKLPPSHPGVDHRIEMKPGFILKSAKTYPLSPKETDAMKAFLDEHITKDFIQPSKSPQASGLFFVGKKDGSLRPCQDYRYINEWMIKNAYPLPLIPPLIAKLSDAKFFMKMDVWSGYNNILIHPDDCWKAAFTTSFGLFEPKVMFFGLCNSPATFQAYMNQTFQKEIAKGWMIIYMDDILIFSKTLEENQKWTRCVLEIIHKETLFLKPKKCTFDAQEVDYLGMIIHPGQVAMDPAKLSSISQWQTPTSVKEVRSFLRFCNFYRHFISHYSNLTQPLIDLTKKDNVFAWTQACTDSFEKLKQCFLSEPVLWNPDPSRQFTLATNASLIATGAVLLQTDENGAYRPCGYLSQSFNPAERNYQIYDRELLAIIRALKAWRHKLEGNPRPVIMFTDHKNLLYFRSAQNLTHRQARWQLTLNEFDLELHHVPGTKLAAPDALSHRPDHSSDPADNADVTLLPDTLFARIIDIDLTKALKSTDPFSDPIIIAAQQALDGLSAPPMKSALSDWRLDDGTLFYKERAYVPAHLRHHIRTLHHDHPTAGHPRRFKTEELVKCDYWWPRMGTFIRKYVEGCTLCQQMKSDTHPSNPPLTPIPLSATRPFLQISVDLVTDLPESGGFDSVMVMVDHGLMKGVILSPCKKTITSEGVAQLFFKKVFLRFGLYDKIISDRGPQFASKFAKELGRLLDYEVALSTAYHPQTDGQTEHLNQELETYLHIYCRSAPLDWVKHLPMAEFVHNHRKHDSRNASPFFLMMGYEPRGIPHILPNSAIPAAEDRIRYLQKTREEAITCHNLATQRMATQSYGKKFEPWKVGEKVWLSAKNLISALPLKKLAPKRYGPFIVEAVLPLSLSRSDSPLPGNHTPSSMLLSYHPITKQKSMVWITPNPLLTLSTAKRNTKSKPFLPTRET